MHTFLVVEDNYLIKVRQMLLIRASLLLYVSTWQGCSLSLQFYNRICTMHESVFVGEQI